METGWTKENIFVYLLEVYSGKGWPEVQRWLRQQWNGGRGDTKITRKKRERETKA